MALHTHGNSPRPILPIVLEEATPASFTNEDVIVLGEVFEVPVHNSRLGDLTTGYYTRCDEEIKENRDESYNTLKLLKDHFPPEPVIPVVYDDWYLPSSAELQAMYDELHAHGVGGFGNYQYWSSSQFGASSARTLQFVNNVENFQVKDWSGAETRACREFTSSLIYALRGTGEAGGLIFNIVDNGDGTYNYLEAAPSNLNSGLAWSNITNVSVSTGTAIGTGQANTTAIIGQLGHTNSAAKECDDLEITI